MHTDDEDDEKEPAPGMLADGKLNVVEEGSPRKEPEVIPDAKPEKLRVDIHNHLR